MESPAGGLNKTNASDIGMHIEHTLPEWTYVFQVVFMVIVAVIGIPGNGLIVLVQFKNRNKSSTDYLILTMAIFELMCSSVNTTMYVIRNLNFVWKRIASESICRTHFFAVTVVSISSSLLLTAIASDRYFKTCRPLRAMFFSNKTKQLCICIAVISVVCSLPLIGTPSYNEKIIICSIDTASLFPGQILQVLLGISFFIMFIVVVICYTRVAIALRKRYHKKVVTKFMCTNQTEKSVTFTHLRGSPRPHKNSQADPQTESIAVLRKMSPQVNTKENQVNSPTNPPNRICPSETHVNIISASGKSPHRDSVSDFKDIQTRCNSSNEESESFETPQLHRNTTKKKQSEMVNDSVVTDNIEHIESPGRNDTDDQEQIIYYENEEAQTVLAKDKLFEEERKLNRTTLIMFLTTMVYILSWLIHWLAYTLSDSDTFSGRVATQLTKNSFMVTCMINPVFYFCMSSLSRKNAKQLIR